MSSSRAACGGEQAGTAAPVDLRLACGAVAGWVAVLACLERSGTSALVAALGCTLAGLLAWLLAVRGVRACGLLALALFCAAAVLFPLAGQLVLHQQSPLTRMAASHTSTTVELVVAGDPRMLAAAGPAGSPRAAVDTQSRAVLAGTGWVSAAGRVLVIGPAGPWHSVLPGQRVRISGSLRPPLVAAPLTVGLYARSDPILLGRPPWWQRLAGAVRAGMRQSCSGLPSAVAGLLPGLIDGDTTALDPVLAQRFRVAGLTHLVAVSGTNCSILVGAVLLVLRRLRLPPWSQALLAGVVLVAFVLIARPSPSVLRAAVMAGIALAGIAVGRPRRAVPGLAFAVLALLGWDPLLAVDAGFTMSVLATAALLLIAPGWAAALSRRRIPTMVAAPVAVAAAAHLVTAPVIAAISGQISLVAIPANILVEPAVAPTTVLGFLAAGLAPLWLPAARLIATVAGWPCRWLVWVAEWFGSVGGATLPWPAGTSGALLLVAVLTAMTALAYRVGPRRLLAAGLAAMLLVQIPVRAVISDWPPTGWLMVACDVGQGDAIALNAGPRAAVVIDAGPDPLPIDRCLHDLGITQVPMLAISHYHLDHVGGIDGVFHGRHVGRVISSPLLEPVSGRALVSHALSQHQLDVETVAVGAGYDVGPLRLEVLAPTREFHNTRSDPNNSSLVLRATVAGQRVLLPGDAEVEAQQALLASGADVSADVLKVPHHGSAYSDPAFLAAVHAQVGVISVGAHNDYGHPSPLLLASLIRLGMAVRRTDQDGDVAVTSVDGALSTVVRGTRNSAVADGPAHDQPQRLAAVRPAANGSADRLAQSADRLAQRADRFGQGADRFGQGADRFAQRGVLPASVGGARMGSCRPARSALIVSRSPCPPSSCWSAMRNCWSTGHLARSPPSPAAMSRTWS